MEFREERGIAYCGVACVLCSYEGHEDCLGCVAGFNGKENDCFIRQCAERKDVEGCFACPDYPCKEDWFMLHEKKNRAFNRYAREFGKQALIGRLRVNYENGITYHNPGCKPHMSAGDYDVLETEDEIYQLLRYGRNMAPASGTITIETATLDDCPALAVMNRQLIDDEGDGNTMTVSELENRMRDWFQKGIYTGYVFRSNGETIGYALVDLSEMWMRHFFICREYRRRGYGRKAVGLLNETKRIRKYPLRCYWFAAFGVLLNIA